MVEQLLFNLEEIFRTSPLWGLGVSFLAGVIVSFSPCIYPLIPITLGVVGAASASTKIKGFFISIVFVLGVSVVYTVLGVVSAVFGILLGTFFVNPATYLVLTLIFLLLGAVHFGVIKLNIPFCPNYNYENKGSLVSVFILGMVSGLAIIPCNFPVLGAILSLISLKRSIIYGGMALFLFSLGYGVILVVLGTFTSLIRRLPKQGIWLTVVKKGVGLIFIIMGIYFLRKFITLIM